MSILIGIDAGISSTKIIGIEGDKRIMKPMTVSTADPLPGIYGALGKYLHENNISVDDIDHVLLTGVGSKRLKEPILNLPTSLVDEFKANGIGARFDTGLDHMIVVSMGSGTSLVRVDGDDITHIGGIGMGGGTLLGLSKLLLNTSNINEVAEMASDGYPDLVNLRICDICDDNIDGLLREATASLFANVLNNTPSKNDIAAGIIHMVLETIGSAAVLSQTNGGFKDFVLIGKLHCAGCRFELWIRKRVISTLYRYGTDCRHRQLSREVSAGADAALGRASHAGNGGRSHRRR